MANVSKIKLGENVYDLKDANIPAWARASTKPTYTASEVGALPQKFVINVHLNNGTWSADKTYAEAYAAYQSGSVVEVHWSEDIFSCSFANQDCMQFTKIASDELFTFCIEIASDNNVYYYENAGASAAIVNLKLDGQKTVIRFRYNEDDNSFTLKDDNTGATYSDSNFRSICNDQSVNIVLNLLYESSGEIIAQSYIFDSLREDDYWYFRGFDNTRLKSCEVTIGWLNDKLYVDEIVLGDGIDGLVPISRKINNKELSSNITLTASDVGALPSTTTIPNLSDVKFIVGVTISDNVISNPTKTFSQISTAYNEGKLVIVRDNSGYEYYCEYCDSSDAYFFSADTMNVYYVGVTSSNVWTFSYVSLDTSNLLNSINSKPDVVYMLNNGSAWNQTSYNSGTNSWSVSNTALTGNVKNIYIDKVNNEGYYWNPATSLFVKIGPTVYSWALASTKPTYTASEVGAMATTHPANAITSNDIENWDDKADKIIVTRVTGSGSISRTILPGKFYIFPTLTGLTLTLGTGQGFLIYGGKFTADSSGCTLTLPSGTTVAPGCPSIEGGNTYEFNILEGSLILALI